MTHVVFLLLALALLAGFLILSWYETQRGVRVLASSRARLDRSIARIEFILTHVDFAMFLRDELRRLLESAGHRVAQLSLELVRAVERLLTRLVRHFRTRSAADQAPRESVREFVKTLSDFKGQLETTRPPMPEIE